MIRVLFHLLFAIASVSFVISAPAPALVDTRVRVEKLPSPDKFDRSKTYILPSNGPGNVTVRYIPREQSFSAVSYNKDAVSKGALPPVPGSSTLAKRAGTAQIWVDFYFKGATSVWTPNRDSKGYYIGDWWNDKISSIANLASYQTCEYSLDVDFKYGTQCYGYTFTMQGLINYESMSSGWNDKISCFRCW